MTTYEPRCPALHPGLPYSRCAREKGHGMLHCNASGNTWDYSSDLMDGGVTAALIDQEAEQPRPLTARENLAALWESAHRPVGGRIPAGTAIITRSDHGNGDVRYKTLEATGRDLPDEGRTLERNYPYGPENGEEYRLLDPPARPEGAEELARLIATADVGEWDCGDLADALLATGRVRVTGAES